MDFANATRVQWPVGKGGFSTGRIEGDGTAFNYVYDCGATSKARLSTIIDFYGRETRSADLVFISHLDSDHVNGIEMLAAALDGIKAVVMPYLSMLDVLVLVCEALDAGALTEAYAEALTDTAGWLSRNGIASVIYVGKSEFRNGEPAPPEPPYDGEPMRGILGPNPETEGPWSVTFDGRAIMRLPQTPGRADEYWLDGNSGIRMGRLQKPIWQFIPFVPRFEDASVRKFEQEIEKLEGDDGVDIHHPEGLRDYIKSVNNRRKLKKCYKALAADRNKTCLCLATAWDDGVDYVRAHIVRAGAERGRPCPYKYWPWIYQHSRGSVWLHTGDLHLKAGPILDDYVARHRDVMDRIRVFQLPHHGSRHSFDQTAMKAISPHVVFATVNEPSKNHPHPDVVDIVAFGGAQFYRVTKDGDAMLSEISQCGIP